MRSPSRDADKIMVRLPDGLRPRLKAAADRNRRSVNAEVVTILETHLEKTETAGASAKSTPTV